MRLFFADSFLCAGSPAVDFQRVEEHGLRIPLEHPFPKIPSTYHILSKIVTYITTISETQVPNYWVVWTLRVYLIPRIRVGTA